MNLQRSAQRRLQLLQLTVAFRPHAGGEAWGAWGAWGGASAKTRVRAGKKSTAGKKKGTPISLVFEPRASM